jgi:hypothetical protein
MDPTRFDRIAKRFAARRLSRRQALRQGGTGLAVGALAAAGVRRPAGAQEATPAAGAAGKVPFMFVQTFGSGSLAPKPGEEGVLTLTAEHLAGQTLFFSDRQERVVGMVATERFLGTGGGAPAGGTPTGGLGFTPADPPNAALVFGASGEAPGEVVVVELLDPTYDPATGTATYEVRVLADEAAVDLTLVQQPATAAEAPREFGAASLFIDDCPDGYVYCVDSGGTVVAYRPSGYCFSQDYLCCAACGGGDMDYWAAQCNAWYPSDCNGGCRAGFDETWACNWAGSA